MPILAKIAVIAANTAESTAQACHDENIDISTGLHAFGLHRLDTGGTGQQLNNITRRLLVR